MIFLIDAHRSALGVEPICRLLAIAPSKYYEVITKRTDVDRLSARARRDIAMKVEIGRVFNENFQVYGVRKVRRHLARRLRHRPLHRCSAYERHWVARRHSQQTCQNHRIGQGRAMPARPSEQALNDRQTDSPFRLSYD